MDEGPQVSREAHRARCLPEAPVVARFVASGLPPPADPGHGRLGSEDLTVALCADPVRARLSSAGPGVRPTGIPR